MSSRSFARRLVAPALLLALLAGCGGGLGSKTENGNIEVYYKDGATKDEADRFAAYVAKQLPGVGERRSFQLRKLADGYQVRMPLKKEYQADDKMLNSLSLDAARYSRDVFQGAAVEMEGCDERMNTLKTVALPADLRRGVVDGQVELFHAADADKDEVDRLAKHLKKLIAGNPSPLVTFVLARRGDVRELHMASNQQLVNNPQTVQALDEERKDVSKSVFNGAPTEWHLCDAYMNVFKVIK